MRKLPLAIKPSEKVKRYPSESNNDQQPAKEIINIDKLSIRMLKFCSKNRDEERVFCAQIIDK